MNGAKWFKRLILGYLLIEVVGQMGGKAANGRCMCPYCMAMNFMHPTAQSVTMPGIGGSQTGESNG